MEILGYLLSGAIGLSGTYLGTRVIEQVVKYKQGFLPAVFWIIWLGITWSFAFIVLMWISPSLNLN